MINRNTLYFLVICITFWVLGVSNFLFEEFVPSVGESKREVINSLANIVLLFFGILSIRKKNDLILIGAFIILGAFSSIYNHVPTGFWISEMRRYIPVILCVPLVRYIFTCPESEKFQKSLDKQLFIFLVLQAVCVTWQFIKYGAGDHGGGSMGNWNSGNISLCIILISFYFITKNWNPEDYFKSLWKNRIYIFLLFPVLLNETKVSFLLIFVLFVLLFQFSRKSMGKLIVAVPATIIAGILLGSVYLWATNSQQNIYEKDFFQTYLTGGSSAKEILDDAQEASDFIEELVDQVDEGEWLFLDIPRFMKLGFLFPMLNDARGGLILGAGFGHLTGFKNTTDFAEKHIVSLFGTRMMIHYIFFPMGILGLIWAFFWYKNILSFRCRPYPMSFRVKLFLLFVILLTFLYNEFFNTKVCCIIFYIICFANVYKPEEIDSKTDAAEVEYNNTGL